MRTSELSRKEEKRSGGVMVEGKCSITKFKTIRSLRAPAHAAKTRVDKAEDSCQCALYMKVTWQYPPNTARKQ